MSDDEADEVLDAAADELYAADPDGFLALRKTLADRARANGDGAAARRIGALRKPTLAASVVNRLVHDDPPVVDQLLDLGDRMRTAQADLDAAVLRDLTVERRTVVGELARRALRLAGQDAPTSTLRDDVVATVDAAVADPEIAGRLGRLVRPERWSGFGVAPAEGTHLRVVPGGRSSTAAGKTAGKTAGKAAGKAGAKAPAKAVPTAEARQAERAARKAREAFDAAQAALDQAEADDTSAAERVTRLTVELAQLQQSLDEAKGAREQIRAALRSARTKRREAQSALDRAERRRDRAGE